MSYFAPFRTLICCFWYWICRHVVSDTLAIVFSPFIIKEFQKKFVFWGGNLLVFVSFKNSLTVIINFYGSFNLSLHNIFSHQQITLLMELIKTKQATIKFLLLAAGNLKRGNLLFKSHSFHIWGMFILYIVQYRRVVSFLLYLKCLHKCLCSTLSNSTQVINKVSLGHTNSSVHDGQGVIIFVRNQFNFQILRAVKLSWVSQTLITNFVKSLKIHTIQNQINHFLDVH